MSPRLAFALETVAEAGRVTLEYFQRGVAVDLKADESPITRADREAEALIRRSIAQRYPEDGILGEEEGEGGPAGNRWVIDPIDGTKSFVAGVPLYACLLSYEVDGEPVIGVAHFPALGETVYAERGHGAFLNDRPCFVSSQQTPARSIIACGGLQSMAKYGRLEPFVKIGDHVMATRTWSDAYGHCLVATGRVEGMVDPIVAHWDISAVSLIVREAGGRCTNFVGAEGLHREAISSNGHLHEFLLEAYRA